MISNAYKALIFLCVITFLFPNISFAQNNKFNVYLFTSGDSSQCPYCQRAINYFKIMQKGQFPNMTLLHYPLSKDPKYYEKFQYFAKAYNIQNEMVPVVFIGERAVLGYEPNEYKELLTSCTNNPCIDPEDYLIEKVQTDPDFSEESSLGRLSNPVILAWVGIIIFLALVLIGIFSLKK